VEQISREDAAQKVGIPRDTLKVTLWRYRKLRELVKQAAGLSNNNN